jgi:hypothetical protein
VGSGVWKWYPYGSHVQAMGAAAAGAAEPTVTAAVAVTRPATSATTDPMPRRAAPPQVRRVVARRNNWIGSLVDRRMAYSPGSCGRQRTRGCRLGRADPPVTDRTSDVTVSEHHIRRDCGQARERDFTPQFTCPPRRAVRISVGGRGAGRFAVICRRPPLRGPPAPPIRTNTVPGTHASRQPCSAPERVVNSLSWRIPAVTGLACAWSPALGAVGGFQRCTGRSGRHQIRPSGGTMRPACTPRTRRVPAASPCPDSLREASSAAA